MFKAFDKRQTSTMSMMRDTLGVFTVTVSASCFKQKHGGIVKVTYYCKTHRHFDFPISSVDDVQMKIDSDLLFMVYKTKYLKTF